MMLCLGRLWQRLCRLGLSLRVLARHRRPSNSQRQLRLLCYGRRQPRPAPPATTQRLAWLRRTLRTRPCPPPRHNLHSRPRQRHPQHPSRLRLRLRLHRASRWLQQLLLQGYPRR